jgi:hypothetical protein
MLIAQIKYWSESFKDYLILRKVRIQLLKETKYIYNFGWFEFSNLPKWNQDRLLDLYIKSLLSHDYTDLHFFMKLWSGKNKLKGVASNYWAVNGKAKRGGNVVR